MSTPVSRTMLDLDRFRRMRQRAASSPAVMKSPPPNPPSNPPSLPPDPPTSTPSSTLTPKKVMTWKQLETTLTPKERRDMLINSRRSNSAGRRRPSSSKTTPNENRPMNSKNNKSNFSAARNNLSISTGEESADVSTSLTPKSQRLQRLQEKGHLLTGYKNHSATPDIPDLSSKGTGLSSSSSSLDIPPPPPKSPGRERLVEKGRHYLSSSSASHSRPATPDVLSLHNCTPKSPKSPRRQRLTEKGHLLKGRSKTPPSSPGAGLNQTMAKLSTRSSSRNNNSKNIPGSILKKPKASSTLFDVEITVTPAATKTTPAAWSSSANTTSTPSSISSSDFQTPLSTLLSSTKSAATARNSEPFQTPQSAFTTPQSSIIATTPMTPSTFDRSRSASVDLRRSATPGRWRSVSRLYARASGSAGRSKSRERATTPSTVTSDEQPRSQSTGRLQSAAKLYVRATTPDNTACTAFDSITADSASKQQQTEKQESSVLRNERRSRSMEKARHAMARKSRSKTPERRHKLSPPRPSTSNGSMTSMITSGGSTRRNLDKRTARLMHANSFASDILKYRQESASPRPVHSIDQNLLERGNTTGGVSVVVRKRPIFEYELHAGDFDVVFTEARSEDSDAVVVYSTMMHADMRQMLVKPHAFACSAAFDDDCSNDDLYLHVGQPLVQRVVVEGGMATLLMFGQTGSGKTHTMSGMEEHMTNSLFELLENEEYQSHVTVQFVELSGKLCRDLLEDGDVRVAENEDGSVRLLNAACRGATDAKELYEIICYGKRRRATEATGRNGVSSRSHAVCQITVTRTKADTSRRGVLTLLDCAGTERRNDSVHHSRERQKESAEINASLWALKECIRARAAGGKGKRIHVPYRSSNLTRVLRETLENEAALLCVVATVAPNATDTEHTLETLRTVSTLVGMDGSLEEGETHVVSNSPTNVKEEELLTPKQWNHQHLIDFLKKKRLYVNDVPSHLDGRLIMRMSPVQLKNILYDKDNADKADALFRLLRAENDRVSRILIKRRLASSQNQPVVV